MTREHWSGQIDRYLCAGFCAVENHEKLIGRYAEMLAVFLMENPMTTNVIVQAHCSEINKVVVTITEEGQETEVRFFKMAKVPNI